MKRIMLLVGIVIAFAGLAAGISRVRAAPADATFAVNDPSDAVDNNIGDGICLAANGKCTLRAAIQEANARYAANPGSTYTVTVPGGVFFIPKLYSLTLIGSNEDNAATGDLDIKSNLLIESTTFSGARISASGLGDRVFHIIQPPSGPINVTIIGVSFSDGSVGDRGGGMLIDTDGSVTLTYLQILTNTVTAKFGQGGGISSDSFGTLTLNNVLMRANQVLVTNGGAGTGGAISTFENLVVNGGSLTNNVVTFDSPSSSASGQGGAISMNCCVGSLTLNNSSVLTNSVAIGGNAFGFGGGIYTSLNPVTITNSTINGNLLSASGSNVSFLEGGGLYAYGAVTLTGSTVANNKVSASTAPTYIDGGGLALNGSSGVITSTITGNAVQVAGGFGGYGGGISLGGSTSGGNLLVDRSVVYGNTANDGGGLNSFSTTALAVRNSTVEVNVATNGAGIFNVGVLTVTNSTFYLNAAAKSGGGIYNSNKATVESATFFANVADYDADNVGDGGGIFVAGGATQYLGSSLLTGEEDRTTGGPVLPDCAGTVISLDYNLIQQVPNPSGCNVIIGTTTHNKIGTFPNVLDPTLRDNGGPTQTLALLPGSAAIDAGDPTGCKDENGSPLTTDQRGVLRLGPCDIGAYEAFFIRLYLPLIQH